MARGNPKTETDKNIDRIIVNPYDMEGHIVLARRNPPERAQADYVGRLFVKKYGDSNHIILSPYTMLYEGDTVETAKERIEQAEGMPFAIIRDSEYKDILSFHERLLVWMSIELKRDKINLEKIL